VGFGVESDTYDVLGKVTATAGVEGVTAESVKAMLAAKFTGTFMQTPPVYSARRVNGERLYDMARQGIEVPKEALRQREVDVTEMELVEFWETGKHDFVMKTEDREAFAKGQDKRRGKKRHWRGEDEATAGAPETKTAKMSTDDAPDVIAETTLSAVSATSVASPNPEEPLPPSSATESKEESQQADGPEQLETDGLPPLGPAARIRMTVTSGFYVRSLCHDLAKELGSAGVMAELVRSRQGEFSLGENVLEYDDMAKGEEVWGPKVQSFLEDWQAREAKR
jgi:tRNA pseudouridine55 synthase